MGPRPSNLPLFPVGRNLQDNDYGRSKEELHPCCLDKRGHLFLPLRSRRPPELHAGRKVLRSQKQEGHHTIVRPANFPETLTVELAKRCARTGEGPRVRPNVGSG